MKVVYETIVVPLDDASTSRHAIATAVLLARAWTVPVQLVMVVSPGINPLEATLALERAADEVDAPVRRPVVLADNDVAEALSAHAGTHALICMATHGRSAIGSAVLGSVTREVLAKAEAPVLLVGPRCVPSSELRDICVAVRPGSAFSARAISFAIEWARTSNARLHLVGALSGVEVLAVGDDEERAELGALAQRCRDAGVAASWRLVEGDDIASRVLEAAAEVSASMLVVATHGRGPLARLALGSVAQQLVRRAPCPVLVVPPHAVCGEQS